MIATPLVTWGYVEQWTRAALDKVDTCPQQMDTHHPMFIEWEALSQVKKYNQITLSICPSTKCKCIEKQSLLFCASNDFN